MDWKPVKQTALPKNKLKLLRRIYSSELNARELRRELKPVTDPVLLHYVAWLSAETLTWHDVGFDWPKSVLAHPNCDAGTALMIYWLASPGYAYSVEPDDWQRPNQRDLKKIENAYLGEKYKTQKIAFDPTPFLPKPKDRYIIGKMNYGMTIPSKGRELKPLRVENAGGYYIF